VTPPVGGVPAGANCHGDVAFVRGHGRSSDLRRRKHFENQAMFLVWRLAARLPPECGGSPYPLTLERSSTMRTNWIVLTGILTFCALALTTIRVGAQAVQPTSETYSWSGELVSFDPDNYRITVKSRVVGDQALAELPRFTPGTRIVLTWSGFDTYADAIARAVQYDAVRKWSEPFTFPVEFVAYESARQYVTFTFRVPASSIETVKGVKPGEWVTTISRHRALTETDAITAVHPYSGYAAPTRTH
jgi:hypothetical protein